MADHPVFAAFYDRVSRAADAAGLAARRATLLSAARGRVLEVGAGNGLNLPHYPAAVSGVVALEPDGAMRRRLVPAAAAVAPLPVEIVAAPLEDASLEAGGFDTIVCTLVLCTVPDLAAGLGHIRELLAPGGQVLFLEHVKATGARAAIQTAATPLWRRAMAGCRLDRDTPKAMRDAGLVITDLERFRTSPVDPFTAAMVQGRAQAKVAA